MSTVKTKFQNSLQVSGQINEQHWPNTEPQWQADPCGLPRPIARVVTDVLRGRARYHALWRKARSVQLSSKLVEEASLQAWQIEEAQS